MQKKIRKKYQEGDTITIKVRWAIDAKFSKFFPLHGAIVRVTYKSKDDIPSGLKDLIAYGRLDEHGEFKFMAPAEDLKYKVQIFGHHDKFSISVHHATEDPVLLSSNFDQATNIDIQPDKTHKDNKFHISEAEANSWSVFQALYELTEHVKPIAGIPEAPVFKKVVTNRPTPREAFYRAGSDGGKKVSEMHLGSLKSFDWDTIAHEYGHAVAHLQDATKIADGFHDGSNQYDIEKNPSGEALNTYRNKELSNALALNEAYATCFALNFWKERRYSSEIAWLGDHRLDQTSKRIRWAIRWIWKATQNLMARDRALRFGQRLYPGGKRGMAPLGGFLQHRAAANRHAVRASGPDHSRPACRGSSALLIWRSRGRRFLGALRRFGMAL